MQVTAVKTPKIRCGDNIIALLDAYLPRLQERSIIAISSKIVSLCEEQVVPYAQVASKIELIQKEADAYLMDDQHQYVLTIKHKIIVPSAGIDESNSADGYVLYPEDPMASAAAIWSHLRQSINECGVIITDSTVYPLRRGVRGAGIAWCGFEALYDYRGQGDCFGRPLEVTTINNADALAGAAVLVMGEGAEQTPMAVITDAPHIVFQSRTPTAAEIALVSIEPEQDLYAPLLQVGKWRSGKTTES